jgi:predicted HicB family RNase H-like nuclease
MKKFTASINTRVTPATRDNLKKKAQQRKIRLTDIAREALEEKAQAKQNQ